MLVGKQKSSLEKEQELKLVEKFSPKDFSIHRRRNYLEKIIRQKLAILSITKKKAKKDVKGFKDFKVKLKNYTTKELTGVHGELCEILRHNKKILEAA